MGKRKKEVELDPLQMDMFAPEEAAKNLPSLTDEQRNFIEFKSKKSVILSAIAGSGKTFSCVQRLKFLVEEMKVDPKKIIFFSFTKAATEELKERIGRDDIEIRTIHSYCQYVLTALKKYRNIATFYDFLKWYKKNNHPGRSATRSELIEFEETINRMYEEAEYTGSQISSYKLMKEDGVKMKVPDIYSEYVDFLFQSKQRDMTDLLIEVNKLFKEDRYLRRFKGKYDYIFVDEYQDTSPIQMSVLLSLNAKYYYLIGDLSQSIFGFSGANCNKVEGLLRARRDVVDMTLSVNFRSDKVIVENSNKYSHLEGVSNSESEGDIDFNPLMTIGDLKDVLSGPGEIAVLVRTNQVIKRIEYELLKKRVPIKYSNYINEKDLKDFKKGENMAPATKQKFERIKDFYDGSIKSVYAFIKSCQDSKKFVTSIHKSKGLEFENCVIVNSISPEVLHENGFYDKLNQKMRDKISFEIGDPKYTEAQNIHYVAVSRAKHKNYFMIYDP